MESYDFTVEHRPGRSHGNADAMSRFPETVEGECEGAWSDTMSDLEEWSEGKLVSGGIERLIFGVDVNGLLWVRVERHVVASVRG